MLNKSTIILLSGVSMGNVMGTLDAFQIRDKNHLSNFTKNSLATKKSEFLKENSFSKDKKVQSVSISNLDKFLQEYKNLSPEDAGNTLLDQSADLDSELNKFNILSLLACKLGKASPQEARRLLGEWQDKEEQADLAQSLMKGWAQAGWDEAVVYLLSHRDKPYAEEAFQIIMKDRALLKPEEAIAWLTVQSEEVRSAGLMPVMQGLAEKHPQLVSRFAATTLRPGDLNDVYLLDLVAGTLPRSDWETALKWFNSLDEITREEYAGSAYAAFAEADLIRTTEEFHKEGNTRFAHAVVGSLIKKSPVQAMQWVEKNIKKDKASYFSRIAGDSAAQTPEFAGYIAQMPAGEAKDIVLRAMMRGRGKTISKGDDTALCRPCAEEKHTAESRGNFPDNFFSIEEEDFLECLYRYSRMDIEGIRQEWLKQRQHFDPCTASGFQTDKMDYLVLKWGRISPEQAILELKKGNYYNDISIRMVLNDWMKRETETALSYILKNRKDFEVCDVVDILSSQAPAELIKWIISLSREERVLPLTYAIDFLPAEQMAVLTSSLGKCDTIDDLICSRIASKWATIDWDSTVRWVDSLNHLKKEEREKILLSALTSLSPDKALPELEKRKEMDKISSLVEIADHLARQSREKALDWFLAHVSEEQIQTLDGELPLFFLDAYNAQMVSHVLQLPSGRKKDAVLETMSTKVWGNAKSGRECSLKAPTLEKRMELASRIGSQDKRDSTIKRILTEWVHHKPKKVLEWVEQSSLSTEQKQDFIRQCKESIKEASMPYDL